MPAQAQVALASAPESGSMVSRIVYRRSKRVAVEALTVDGDAPCFEIDADGLHTCDPQQLAAYGVLAVVTTHIRNDVRDFAHFALYQHWTPPRFRSSFSSAASAEKRKTLHAGCGELLILLSTLRRETLAQVGMSSAAARRSRRSLLTPRR